MRVVRSKLPVFFHRRLLLIVVAGVGVSLLLGAKLVQLTIFEGAELRAAAERAIQRHRYLPTWRGSIIDRNGVVLAEDRASWDLALPFEVISDRWAKKQAMLRAQSEFGLEQWEMLSTERQGKEIIDRTGPRNELIVELYEVIARNTPPDREELGSRVESVRQSISRMVASVQTRQRARFEAKHRDRSGSVKGTFVRRPVAEEFQSHVIVTGLDDPTAFEVRRLARELEQNAAKLHGRRELGKPIVELVDGRVRSLPETSRIVTVDRSHLPRPLRSDEPAMLLLTGIGDHVIGRVRERVREEDIHRRPFLNPANQGGSISGGIAGAST